MKILIKKFIFILTLIFSLFTICLFGLKSVNADSTEFNLRYACDDVEDDWFESQIFESVLD